MHFLKLNLGQIYVGLHMKEKLIIHLTNFGHPRVVEEVLFGQNEFKAANGITLQKDW
jgi:hypothetical protein